MMGNTKGLEAVTVVMCDGASGVFWQRESREFTG